MLKYHELAKGLKLMYRYHIYLTILVLGLAVHAGSVPISRVVDGVHDRFQKLNDFQADIIQDNIDMNGMKSSYSGSIYFKKPQKIRLNYLAKKNNSISQIAISDGEFIWLYTAELKQVTKQKLDPKNLPLPLLILGGATQIDEDFRKENYIKPVERETLNKIKTYRIEVVPKTKNPEFTKQILWVDEKTYFPVKAQVTDSLGNQSIILFQDIQYDKNLKDSLFVLEQIPGIRFIDITD